MATRKAFRGYEGYMEVVDRAIKSGEMEVITLPDTQEAENWRREFYHWRKAAEIEGGLGDPIAYRYYTWANRLAATITDNKVILYQKDQI